MAGDDHLQARQADAGVGQHREVEGTLGIGDVHHDLERRRRHLRQVGGGAFEGQGACIDEAGIALGATHRDLDAVGDGVEPVAGADDRGNAEFARDDRGMAGAAAAIGDDGRSTLHHRLPIGIGHVGHQNVAGLDAAHVGEIAHHARDAAADLLADRAAFGDHLAALLQVEALDLRGMAARLHRFRTRLDDEELAADAVLGPFDVHRPLVVALRWSGPGARARARPRR